MQIFQGQDNSTTCSPTISGEVSQEFIGGSASLQNRKQGIDPLALDPVNGICNYFDQASRIKSGGITQGSVRPRLICTTFDNYKIITASPKNSKSDTRHFELSDYHFSMHFKLISDIQVPDANHSAAQ